MYIRNLINRSPYPLRQALKYAYGTIPLSVRYGKVFRNTYNFLQESQWWSREKLEEYQMQQLSKLLHHAYENVPYYRRVFDERGLKPKDIQNVDDLRKLPYLTKEIIRKNFSELLAKSIHESRLEMVRTSGSTVSPLAFYYEKGRTTPQEWAFVWTMWKNVGYQFGTKRANISYGTLSKKGYLWEYSAVGKSLSFSPYNMTEENLPKYVEKLREFKPGAIQAIPSTIIILADFMQRHCISPIPSVKVILLASEMLYSWQRKKLEEVFKCRVFIHYGQTERVVLAGECEKSNEYHIFPQYGVTEVIGRKGERVKKEGEVGEIVGTGFNNYAMPFIRYKVGDIAIWTNKRCECGRQYPLLGRVEGREAEFLIGKDGRFISMTAVPYSSVLSKVKQFQFYQEKPGKLILKVVPLPTYAESDSEHILKRLRDELTEVEVEIRFVDHIPRTGSGKYLYMIQKIPIKFSLS